MTEGVSTYLMLVAASTLLVLWANENVESRTVERLGKSAVGAPVEDVVYMAREVGLIDRLEKVAVTGETSRMSSEAISLEGRGSSTRASIYRLPSGELLLATEWYQHQRNG